MENIKLEKISFSSYIKLNVIAAFGIGIIFGIVMLIGMLLTKGEGSFFVELGSKQITGLTGAILGLIMSPFIFVVVFLWFSILLYLGLLFILRFKKNKTISLKVKIRKDVEV